MAAPSLLMAAPLAAYGERGSMGRETLSCHRLEVPTQVAELVAELQTEKRHWNHTFASTFSLRDRLWRNGVEFRKRGLTVRRGGTQRWPRRCRHDGSRRADAWHPRSRTWRCPRAPAAADGESNHRRAGA